MNRYASIDIGTNAVLLLVMESNAGLTDLCDTSTITRLGEGVLTSGRLTDAAMERTVRALEGYCQILDSYGVGAVDCFGTSALREAENRDDFIRMVRRRTGIHVRVISEYQEAYYTYLSVRDDAAIKGERLLIVDIGGGSTEISRGSRKRFLDYVSLPVGTVKLTERFVRHDPPLPEEQEELVSFVRRQVGGAFTEGAHGDWNIVGMAGTITTLATMILGLRVFDKKKIHGMTVSLATLHEWIEQLSGMTCDARKTLPGMEPGREDLLLQGMILMRQIVATFGDTHFTVSTYGARYGVIYEALGGGA
ncbi:MAG: Ppx/GppA phosphatase family protein [Syntrophorhabdales bacterium]